MKIFHRILLVIFALTNLQCASGSLPASAKFRPFVDSQNAKAISIMTYNIENLFDTTHDEGKLDREYLSLAQKRSKEHQTYCSQQLYQDTCFELDWNEANLTKKMRQTADAILQVRGRGPDILILVEVENINVLKKFNTDHLQSAGYKTAELLEGPDPRGIDIAVLSRFPLAGKSKLHRIEFSSADNKSRGIIEVPLKLPTGDTLYVLGLHFPSQRNPHQERQEAVASLNKILASKGPGALVIAGGDFNITHEEDSESGLFSKVINEKWQVSHLLGCKNCPGSHEYRGGWSFLDALIFSRTGFGEQGKYKISAETIQAPTGGKYQLLKNGKPARFRVDSEIGVSDHLPIYAEFYKQ